MKRSRAHKVGVNVLNAKLMNYDVPRGLLKDLVGELLNFYESNGMEFDREPPTLPEVRCIMYDEHSGPDSFIGTGSGYLTEDQAAFGARLLNALPRLRELAGDLGRPLEAHGHGPGLTYAGRLGRILAILNDEPDCKKEI